MKIADYIRLARPDHWFKNIFLLPGVIVALFFSPDHKSFALLIPVLWGLGVACLIASSYYVLNEILDAPFDVYHPVKKGRPIPTGRISLPLAWMEFVLLSIAGLTGAFLLNRNFGWTGLLLWSMGLLYNLPPIRLKDVPYLDVLSESLNNPLRLALGWYATGLDVIPPFSLIIAYWMFGAFLMSAKRFAEYRQIDNPARAALYRKSFAFYTEERLLVSICYYTTLFALMSGFFIARYKFELILSAPVVAAAMTYYLHMTYKPNSSAQYTENLYREPKLMILVLLACGLCLLLLFIQLPEFDRLFLPRILPPL